MADRRKYPGSVLLIEDDDDQADPFVEMLRADGYAVRRSVDGASGASLAVEWRPNLVIVDLLLVNYADDGDGFEVISRIRSDPSLRATCILAWSGHYVRGRDEIRALRLGADDFVDKAAEYGVLEARVEALVRRSTWMRGLRLP